MNRSPVAGFRVIVPSGALATAVFDGMAVGAGVGAGWMAGDGAGAAAGAGAGCEVPSNSFRLSRIAFTFLLNTSISLAMRVFCSALTGPR